MTIKITQLGNLTSVYGNTIVPVVANIAGTLTTVKGNLDQLTTYIISGPQTDIAVINSNVTLANTTTKAYVDGQITAANAGVTSANVGLKGYVDQGNTIQSAQITAANLGIIGYVDNAVSTANIGIKGYIDQGNTIQSAQITAANLGIIGYVDNAVSTANIGIKGYIDQGNTIQSAAITASNVGMKGYVDNQTYSNVNTNAYLTSSWQGTISGNVGVLGWFAVANVYVPTANNSTGIAGQIVWDSNYLYICIGTDTWKRANIATW